MKSILSEHMGEDFYKLAPLLQQAHLGHKRLSGTSYVTRGNFLAQIVCTLFRFPKASEKIELNVECINDIDKMIWKRNFGGLAMQSIFTQKNEYLVEQMRGMAMGFKAVEKDQALHYEFHFTQLFGIPIPKFLSPKVIAFEEEFNCSYRFKVSVDMFLIGHVIGYGGTLDLFAINS